MCDFPVASSLWVFLLAPIEHSQVSTDSADRTGQVGRRPEFEVLRSKTFSSEFIWCSSVACLLKMFIKNDMSRDSRGEIKHAIRGANLLLSII